MDDEQMKQIMGFITSAVDLAEERFGKKLEAEIQTLRGDMSSEFFSLKRQMGQMAKDIEDIRVNTAKDTDIALSKPWTKGVKQRTYSRS